MSALELRIEPEELVRVCVLTFSPAEEARLAAELRARRGSLVAEVTDAIDDAIAMLDARARIHRWTDSEIEGRRAA